MSGVLDAVASPDTRYRRPRNKLAKNLPMAEFRGKLVFPSTAVINRDAEARRELLSLAARVEGGAAARSAARVAAGPVGDAAGPSCRIAKPAGWTERGKRRSDCGADRHAPSG